MTLPANQLLLVQDWATPSSNQTPHVVETVRPSVTQLLFVKFINHQSSHRRSLQGLAHQRRQLLWSTLRGSELASC